MGPSNANEFLKKMLWEVGSFGLTMSLLTLLIKNRLKQSEGFEECYAFGMCNTDNKLL